MAAVTWEQVPDTSGPFDVLGYKLNWGAPGKVALSSLVALDRSILHYEIRELPLQMDIEIAVWAYSVIGDGTPAREQLRAYNGKVLAECI